MRVHVRALWLTKSNARAVPSRLAVMTALPSALKHRALIAALCSAKVTKQKPLPVFHNCDGGDSSNGRKAEGGR